MCIRERPVIGKMKAAGKTCSQLASDIAATLKNNDYIRDASVNAVSYTHLAAICSYPAFLATPAK